MKKVYFACSIRGGGDKSIYPALVESIKQHAALLSEIFIADGLRLDGSSLPERDIWTRDMEWVKNADVIIAEVTNPSLGVGYEIAKAEEWGKPVLCLFRPESERKLSAMIAGSPSTAVFEYTSVATAEHAISTFLGNLTPQHITP